MSPIIHAIVPLFLFMLMPALLPVFGVVFGAIADRLVTRTPSNAETAVAEAKARTARRLDAHVAGRHALEPATEAAA